MVLAALGNNTVYNIVVIALMLLIAYIIFRLGKVILGLIVNAALGLISLIAIDYFFGMAIQLNIINIIITAILGLPGVALLIILKLFGINL